MRCPNCVAGLLYRDTSGPGPEPRVVCLVCSPDRWPAPQAARREARSGEDARPVGSLDGEQPMAAGRQT